MLRAEIVHCLPGRLRLRIAEKRGDVVSLKKLADCLDSHPEVVSVDVKPNTGGLLVVHSLGSAWQPIGRFARDEGLFAVASSGVSPPPVPSFAETTAASLKVMNRRFRQATGGTVDFQSAMFVTFLGLAVQQARQGYVLGPAMTLILHAYGFLKEKSR